MTQFVVIFVQYCIVMPLPPTDCGERHYVGRLFVQPSVSLMAVWLLSLNTYVM